MDDILRAYESIIASEPSLSWMLMHYPTHTGTVQDELRLHSYGSSGLAEMKYKMSEAGLEHVFIAFYREQEDESRKRRCVLINYLPAALSGVRRARAMVHSRRMSASLPAALTSLTLDHISNLTSSAIFKALADPDSTHVITTSIQSADGEPVPEPPSAPSQIPLPTTSYPSYASSSSPSPPSGSGRTTPQSTPQKAAGMLSNFLKKHVKSPPPSTRSPPNQAPPPPTHQTLSTGKDPDIVDTVVIEREDAPPPPPPKDDVHTPTFRRMESPTMYAHQNQVRRQHYQSSSMDYLQHTQPKQQPPPSPGRDRSQSLSEFAIISRNNVSGELSLSVYDDDESGADFAPPPPAMTTRSYTLPASGSSRTNFIVPLPDKWSSTTVISTSPETRAQLRARAKADREQQELQAIEEEKERQAKFRELKKRAEQEAAVEETRRRAAVDAEIHRATTLRRQKDEQERLEEERKKEELKLKKEAERRKREAEHQRLELWRREKEKEIEEKKRLEEEEVKKAIVTRKKKVASVAGEIKDCVRKGDKAQEQMWFSGEISIQKLGGDTLIWRRRYWKIVGQVMLLYKSAKDTNLILHSIDLRNDVRAIREWHEGYEELKAIPHSFALEFKDRNKDTWSMYADSDSDKVKILALFNYLGGL